MKYVAFFIFSSLLFVSCSESLCGKLSGEWKRQYDSANKFSAKLKLENIPCDFYYINVVVLDGLVDTASIHKVHKFLYNPKNNSGWQALLVYSNEGKYLFTHNYNDSIFIQNGD